MAIPSSFKDELVARSDIVDVVSDYVTLTPKGGSYWGLCPFHGEKTPSFHVLPDRQLYHCFGCGKGGGVVSFVMEMENLPFLDALRLLAKRAGMEFPEGDLDESSRRKRNRLLNLNKILSQPAPQPCGAAGPGLSPAPGAVQRDYDPLRLGVCPGQLGQPHSGHGPERV